MSKKVGIVVLVVIIVLSGFGREYVMKNINWVVKYLTQGGNYWSQPLFNPLLRWSVNEIVVLKWGLTIAFTLYFYGLTLSIINLRFKGNKNNLKFTSYLYLALVVMSFSLMCIEWSTTPIYNLYPIIRNLMGLAQSFIPLMVLFLIFKFFPQKKA